MNNQETLTRYLGDISQNINAEEVLSSWYGPDSLVCHSAKRDGNIIEAYFVVTENLCAPEKRPPMFDQIVYKDGALKVTTSDEDAREHFIDRVGFKVVPGHGLAGLMTPATEEAYFNQTGETNFFRMTGFDFMRYKGFILPRWNIEISGPITIDEDEITISPTINHNGERKALGKNFRFVKDESTYSSPATLDHHWKIEAAAQAMGVGGSIDQAEGIVPILSEVGKSHFERVDARPGDILVSKVEILMSDESQMVGNIEQRLLDGRKVSKQEKMILLFAPMENIRKAISDAS